MRDRMFTPFALAALFLLSTAIGACTMRAPGAPAATAEATEATGPEATMQAVRSAILTQTAAAAEGMGGGGEQTPPVEATAPTPTVTPTPLPTATPTPSGPTTYVVQEGDWLLKIARDFDVDPEAIIAANPGLDPNVLYPGDELIIPAPGTLAPTPAAETPQAHPTTYTVQAGDWVYSIARKFGVDPDAIIEANNMTSPYTVHPGDELIIP